MTFLDHFYGGEPIFSGKKGLFDPFSPEKSPFPGPELTFPVKISQKKEPFSEKWPFLGHFSEAKALIPFPSPQKKDPIPGN